MAIDKDSNGYTIGFAVVLVAVVGTILTVAALGLKPYQDENFRQDKMKSILMSFGAVDSKSNMADAPDLYESMIQEDIVLDFDGNIVEGKKAFDINVKKEYRAQRNKKKRNYPLYKFKKDGNDYYVVPMVGNGLWGPIWGYIALESDKKTVAGASFAHKGETPGLGAEISQAKFQDAFKGEMIFDDNDRFATIQVLKGNAKDDDKHAVNGITGGTITSNGVAEMIKRTLKVYTPYFKK